jgi:diguanylate cyclase (GGDEF)-like protein
MLFTGIPLATMRAATQSTMRIVMIGTPIALVLSLGLLYLITRPLHRTIRRAVDVAQGLARGDVDQTTGRASNDELGEVNAAFNDIIAYHQRMVYLADAIAGGNLAVDVAPNSQSDRLGVAFARMTQNLRDLVIELETTAVTDKLTQLGNRRAFDDHLLRELSRASRHSEALSLAFIDVDHFKAINDKQGHQAGDEVLAKLGEILKTVRLEDRSFRLGGDEFAIVMPRTTVSEAKLLAERVRSAVQKGLPDITLSIGIADTFDGVYEAELLRANADAALYLGKEQGRDAIVGFEYVLPRPAKDLRLVGVDQNQPKLFPA